MKKWICILTLVLIFQGSPLFAEQATYKLDPITVEAQRQFDAERNLETIDLTSDVKPVVSTVPDALDKTSGLDIQRRSILTPKSSQVRIRGFDERRSLILLDGRPLNGTGVMGGQFVDWSMISTEDWKSAEIGKGAFSAKYGNTLGGTINLVPPPLQEGLELTAGAGVKRYDTHSFNASGSGRSGSLGARISGGWVETQGHLRNSEAERGSVSADFFYFWGDHGEIRAGIRHTDGDFNMPVENDIDLIGFDDSFPESTGDRLVGPGIRFPAGDRHGDGSFYNKKRTELDLGLKNEFFGFDTELKLYHNHEKRKDAIFSYNQGVKVLEREAEPDRSRGWVARMSRTFGDHRIGFGADGNYQGYGGSINNVIVEGYFPQPPTDGRDEWDATRYNGVFVDERWSVLDNLNLYLGLRYEDYHGDRQVDRVTGYAGGRPEGYESIEAKFDENALLPKFGLVYRPADEVSLFGRFARATRFPDNPAFYWYFGGYRPEVDPDSNVVRKDLTYENALQYELGLSYKPVDRMTLSLSYYNYQVDDYIRWIFGYAPSRLVYNIDRVDFQGIELDMQGRIIKDFWAFCNVTWQETEKQGDVFDAANELSNSLSELPELKINLGLKYEMPRGLMAKATMRWVDETEVPYLGGSAGSPDGAPVGRAVTLQEIDDFTVVDVLLRYPLWKDNSYISGGVENLFDAEYEEELGFPAPGRVFHISAEVRF